MKLKQEMLLDVTGVYQDLESIGLETKRGKIPLILISSEYSVTSYGKIFGLSEIIEKLESSYKQFSFEKEIVSMEIKDYLFYEKNF